MMSNATLPFAYRSCLTFHTLQPLHPSETLQSIVKSSATTSTTTLLKIASAIGEQIKKVGFGILENSTFSIELFSEFLRNCTQCESLDFSHCRLNNETLKSIAEACKNHASNKLTKIFLHSISAITLEGVAAFNAVPSLKKVSLQHNIHITHVPHPENFSFKVQLNRWNEYGGY